MENNTAIFERERGRLFGLAYRMLGSVADAEDVLQEVCLRWLQQDSDTIANPAGWLLTVVTRECIDWQRSARHRREHYVGVWLPEPLLESFHDTVDGPQAMTELANNLTLAFLHLLEKLNPLERAVLLLRQAFDWPFSDIAATLGKTEAHCRQLFKRAQEKIGGDIAMTRPDANAERLLLQFMQTCTSGDFSGLLNCLHEDLIAYSDGGGKVRSLLRPIAGSERVARFLRRIIQPRANLTVIARMINGEPGLLAFENGQPVAALIFAFREQKLWRLYSIRNPDKLTGALFDQQSGEQ